MTATRQLWPTTDGLLVVRYLLGLRGAAFSGAAVGLAATPSTIQLPRVCCPERHRSTPSSTPPTVYPPSRRRCCLHGSRCCCWQKPGARRDAYCAPRRRNRLPPPTAQSWAWTKGVIARSTRRQTSPPASPTLPRINSPPIQRNAMATSIAKSDSDQRIVALPALTLEVRCEARMLRARGRVVRCVFYPSQYISFCSKPCYKRVDMYFG